MPARLRYKGLVYRLEDGHWRGPDGHTVHLLTWVTDDLGRDPGLAGPDPDFDAARRVAERLGEKAQLLEP